MLVNISNHPSAKWGEKQRADALCFGGGIVDIPFPTVPPMALMPEISALARELMEQVREMACTDKPTTIHIMGEASLVWTMINMLKKAGYMVVVSTTERCSVEKDGVKTSVFNFAQFREIY